MAKNPMSLTTAEALSAVANPTRGRILDTLSAFGPQTVSMLSERLGVAVGSTSHHVKVLEAAGLVEEAPELARDRREHWWRPVSRTVRWSRSEFSDDPAAVAAADTAEELLAARQTARVGEWLAKADPTGPWAGSAFHSSAWLQLTPAELRELMGELGKVVERWMHQSAANRDAATAEAEPVYFFARGFPSQP